MNDMEKIERAFNSQSKLKSPNWTKLNYEVYKSVKGDYKLTVNTMQVGFIFSSRGRLKGMFNWKE